MWAEARILFHHKERKRRRTQRHFVLSHCIQSTICILGGGLLDGERDWRRGGGTSFLPSPVFLLSGRYRNISTVSLEG